VVLFSYKFAFLRRLSPTENGSIGFGILLKNDAKSFIVRIWIESPSEDLESPTWRGVIEHVGTSDRVHFHKLTTMTEFIHKKTGLHQPIALVALWQSTKNWIKDELRKWNPNIQ